jgi:hypothetical protein
MAKNTDAWLKRSKEVIAQGVNSYDVVPFAASLLAALYGPQSAQLAAFNSRMKELTSIKTSLDFYQRDLAFSTIMTVIGEIENGLVDDVRSQVAGEVLAELVNLGKEILQGEEDSAKNVSAVLIAAAFEDLMRRMGAELAGVVGRPKLDEVISALKNAGILKGSEVSIALSYLPFRNDSLHADWPRVQKSQVQSCIAFIEALLMKHFS